MTNIHMLYQNLDTVRQSDFEVLKLDLAAVSEEIDLIFLLGTDFEQWDRWAGVICKS